MLETATQIQAGNIMARLREHTAEPHHATEQHPLQRALATGKLSRETYAAYLGQLFHLHRALEQELRRHHKAGTHRAMTAVYRPDVDKAALLENDLAVLGLNSADVEASLATRALVERIRALGAQSPVALLGMLYVLEGSTNGGRYIARAVTRAYGLSDRKGYSYLDPYGDDQPLRWQRFKADMDAAAFNETESAAIVEAASAMFTGISAISDAVWQQCGETCTH